MRKDRAVDHRSAWIIAILLWLTTAGITAFEIVPASVLSLVVTDLSVSPTAVSWLVSVFILGMVILAVPAGLVLDRRNNRHIILLSAILFLISTVWTALASLLGLYWMMVVARLVGGALNVILWTASVNIVGAAFDRAHQGTSIGFLTTSIPGGFAISHVLTPIIAGYIGWERSFVVYGVMTALAGMGFWLYTRRFDIRTQVMVPTRRDFLKVLQNKYVWGIGGLAFAAFSLNMFFNNWLPSYLASEFHFSLTQSGIFAAVFPAIGMVARMASGTISDRWMGRRRKPIVLGSFIVIAPIIVAIALLETVIILLIALVIAGFVTQMGVAVMLPYVREIVDKSVAGTALSVLNLVGFLGAFSAPVFTGFLIDTAGGYGTAFGYATALALFGIVLSWIIPDVIQGVPSESAEGNG